MSSEKYLRQAIENFCFTCDYVSEFYEGFCTFRGLYIACFKCIGRYLKPLRKCFKLKRGNLFGFNNTKLDARYIKFQLTIKSKFRTEFQKISTTNSIFLIIFFLNKFSFFPIIKLVHRLYKAVRT